MTAIVALKTDDKIYIGGDRLETSYGGTKHHLEESKVGRLGSDMIFGAAGSSRGCQIIAYNTSPPKMAEGEGLYEYLAGNFADCLRNAFKGSGHLNKHHGEEASSSSFILGYKGRIFVFSGSFSFSELTEDYIAIGSGGNYALGVLYATEGIGMNPEDRILLALEAAEHFNAYVQGPFDIVTLEVPK